MPQEKNTSALNQEMIDKASKKYSEKEDVTIFVEVNGETIETYLTIDKYFSQTNISNCITEFMKQISYARTLGIPEEDSIYECYMMFMIIKHFTELEFPNDFEGQVSAIRKMLDSKLLYQIFAKFDPHEIHNVTTDLVKAINDYDDEITKMKKRLKEEGYEDPFGELNFDDIEDEE